MTTPQHSRLGFLDLGRLVSLIDGVFAVAMTLLVLDLKLPKCNGDLAHALWEMLPQFLIYLIAFVSVAGYWTLHHSTFRHIRHGDGRLILLSLLNLLFVTLYPVSASIVGAHPLDPLAAACLSSNSLLYCLSAWALWSYAGANDHLLADDADRQTLKRTGQVMLLVGVGLGVAIPMAFLSVYLAYAVWILWPGISATWVNRRWMPAN
jgi:TMEM175 potassium channel family protein